MPVKYFSCHHWVSWKREESPFWKGFGSIKINFKKPWRNFNIARARLSVSVDERTKASENWKKCVRFSKPSRDFSRFFFRSVVLTTSLKWTKRKLGWKNTPPSSKTNDENWDPSFRYRSVTQDPYPRVVFRMFSLTERKSTIRSITSAKWNTFHRYSLEFNNNCMSDYQIAELGKQ